MTVALKKAPAPRPPVRSSRWAWWALLLTLPVGALAVWMSFVVLGDENIKWWGNLVFAVMVLAPPLAGIVLGGRSALSGNRVGAHAGAIGAAWLGFWIVFWYLANYPFNSESGAVPLSLAAVAAIVMGAATETWYQLRSRP